jgi:hypothetical protein
MRNSGGALFKAACKLVDVTEIAVSGKRETGRSANKGVEPPPLREAARRRVGAPQEKHCICHNWLHAGVLLLEEC